MSTPPLRPSRQERRDGHLVSHHLPSGFSADFDGVPDTATTESASNSAKDVNLADGESSLKLKGGDIHRSLFKMEQRAKLHQRSQTFAAPRRAMLEDDIDQNGEHMTATEQQILGGFRREYVQRRQQPIFASRIPVTRNFVEFLDLYGSFAGEDLADSDDDNASLTDDEEETSEQPQERHSHPNDPDERRPLLGRRKSTRTKQGDASTTKTFFTLLKAFIGTGIMFLPKAFNNGGILFSSMCMVAISAISMLAFHLLLQCRKQYGGGYGEIGQAIGGSKFRGLILSSITLSQLGFVCAGMVFVAQNLYSFSVAVAKREDGASPMPTSSLIALQLAVIIPLAFIRNISKLGPAALLADVFILIGVIYIYYYDISYLASNGLNASVVLFNSDSYTMTIGSCIFTFEGIGLILPIQSSMKKPQNFEPLLGSVMLLITIIFTSVGALCYATFGTDTKIEVIDNFPQSSQLVNAVQFLYSIAVLVGNPVQLFPAIRIMEGKLFKRSTSGKKDATTKWKKNGFRTALACAVAGVAILGAENLDRFVALIGSFACVPLVYIYPPLLHYRGIAQTRWEKAGDVALMILGVVGMFYTTAVTIRNSFL